MEFLKAIDWQFILQIVILGIVFSIGNFFYKHSGWLNTNKPLEIGSDRFPKFNHIIENQVNKEKFAFNALTILLGIPALLGGFLSLFIIGKGILHEFENVLLDKPWWEQLIICFCLMMFYFTTRIWWDGKKIKNAIKKNELRNK